MKKILICLMFVLLFTSFTPAQKAKTMTGIVLKSIAENRWAGIVVKVGKEKYGIQTDYMPSAGDETRRGKPWQVKMTGKVWEVGRKVQVFYTKTDCTFDYEEDVPCWLKVTRIVEIKSLKKK